MPEEEAHGVCLLVCLFLLFSGSMSLSLSASRTKGSIGAIVDCKTRSGREELIAMEMALEDFRNLTRAELVLHVQNSSRDPVRAASIAMALINDQHVQAIIGPRTWQEGAFIVELGQRAKVPILSFSKAYPPSALERWPFLVRIAHNQQWQMRAIAAIVQSWNWRRVTVIYEDTDYTAASIIPHLANALRDVGSEVDHRLPLLPSATSFSKELKILKSRQCRVFVVHTSMQLATRLFTQAKHLGMMSNGSVWITTDGITSLLDPINPSVIASMQGILGVKDYYHPSSRISHFSARFRRRFNLKYPEEESNEPQVFALQAYDGIWAVASAMERTSLTGKFHRTSYHGPKESSKDLIPVSVSEDGPSLLNAIRQSNFSGLGSEFHFIDGEFAPPKFSQIINVVGKSYRELGFWSCDSGFSVNAEKSEGYGSSMEILGQVFWPGGPWTVPKGWTPPTAENPLKIAVPAEAVFRDFVTVTYVNHNETIVEGFSVNVFRETVNHLPYFLPYKFIPYNGTYDTLVEHDHMKAFDLLVGDTSISSGRYHFVEFSQPYTPSGLVMVVPARPEGTSQAWIFLKPFTASLWALTAAISMYNGLVVWLIERKSNNNFQGSFWSQAGTLFCFSAFTTLLSPGDKLHSNLSRAAMVVWLFAALVLTSNYTASLSSMLTARRLKPNFATLDSLKNSNALVGCNNGSVVGKYLEEVLGFRPENIRKFSREDDYPLALRNGHIKAAFLRVIHADLLMAKYCKEFVITGPTYHVGGLGFGVSQVFPKGSPLLSDISQALLQVFENGLIQRLETAMLSSYNCTTIERDDTDDRLSPDSFWGLFGLTMIASTIALVIFGLCFHNGECDNIELLQEPTRDNTEEAIDVNHLGIDDDDEEARGTEHMESVIVPEDYNDSSHPLSLPQE